MAGEDPDVSGYAFDRSWNSEDDRLAAVERQLDPVSQAAITQLGVAAGARCWEVGAGSAARAALSDSTRVVIGGAIVTALAQRPR